MADKAELIIRLQDDGREPISRRPLAPSSSAGFLGDPSFMRAGWTQPIMPAATIADWRATPPAIRRPIPSLGDEAGSAATTKATSGLLALAKGALTAAAATTLIERTFSTFNALVTHTQKTWSDLIANRPIEAIIDREEMRNKIKYGFGFGTAGAVAGGIIGAPGGPAGSAAGAALGGSIGGYGGVRFAESLANSQRAYEKVANDLVGRGRQIAPFSGQLTQAVAKADIRSFMADIREAQTVGPGMARLTESKSRFETILRDALNVDKGAKADQMADQYDKLTELAQSGKFAGEQLQKLLPDLSNLAELPNIKKAMDEMPKRFLEKLKEDNKKGVLDWFMKLGDPRNVPKVGFPNVPDVEERRLFVPAFEG
jgi:hypothetical protein